MEGLRLEEITKEDLEWVRNLRNENAKYFFDSTFITEEKQREWYRKYTMKGKDLFFYVLFIGNERVGTVSTHFTKEKGQEIGNVLIEKKWRKKGIVKEVINRFNTNLWLAVKPNNREAIAVYRKIGFRPTKLIMEKP